MPLRFAWIWEDLAEIDPNGMLEVGSKLAEQRLSKSTATPTVT